ncbi:MAG: IS3 family transposase [Clostridium sp.]|jgi:transposase InsO family protein/transposase-like protein|nr:IS3 family transposase [Clostridium sp.]
MPHKGLLPAEEKIKVVEKDLAGEIRVPKACQIYKINEKILHDWVRLYKIRGATGLCSTGKNRKYEPELKRQAAEGYLSGAASLRDICMKYDISNKSMLQQWIKCYNSYGDFKHPNSGGATCMTKGRKTTLEERIEIVSHCIANNKDYGKTAEQYGASYQQIYGWVRKYEKDGMDGLSDRRGKRKDETAMSETEKLCAQLKLKEAEILRLRMENELLKKLEALERGAKSGLSLVRLENKYLATQALNKEKSYPISTLCDIISLNRSSYYNWLHRGQTAQEVKDAALIERICQLYQESNGIFGYRRIRLNLKRRFGVHCNKKRVRRVMNATGLKSVIRRKRPHYVKSTPEITAENILNRNFNADKLNEKWLTDVTEFKYGDSGKMYLSAVLDLKDKIVVAYAIGHSSNNKLIFDTFDAAVAKYPDAKPLFHSDRGFQYTSEVFKAKLDTAGMTQSMSRVGRCIDNGPMEAFWGTLKAERYYLHRFDGYDNLKAAAEQYIAFYNGSRYQEKLGGLAPLEYRNLLLTA